MKHTFQIMVSGTIETEPFESESTADTTRRVAGDVASVASSLFFGLGATKDRIEFDTVTHGIKLVPPNPYEQLMKGNIPVPGKPVAEDPANTTLES